MAEVANIASPTLLEAFAGFDANTSALALPLAFSEGVLQPLAEISYPKDPESTFQQALVQLDEVLNQRTPLYLILRRNDVLVAITFVPYMAKSEQRNWFLTHRHHLIKALGEERFALAFICKEIGEITDGRSWAERDGQGRSWNAEIAEPCDDGSRENNQAVAGSVKDLGYKQNQCRLCDRRMKYKIDVDAVDALKKLTDGGSCVQMSLNISTEILQLNFVDAEVAVNKISQKLPTDRPSLTFYRHPDNHLLYFIFCSPDSASVQERMKHTMALPGLVNIIAEDNGVYVDQKIEIHETDELEFKEHDDRTGRFRSMYLRNESVGTESTYTNIEADKKILNSIR